MGVFFRSYYIMMFRLSKRRRVCVWGWWHFGSRSCKIWDCIWELLLGNRYRAGLILDTGAMITAAGGRKLLSAWASDGCHRISVAFFLWGNPFTAVLVFSDWIINTCFRGESESACQITPWITDVISQLCQIPNSNPSENSPALIPIHYCFYSNNTQRDCIVDTPQNLRVHLIQLVVCFSNR